MIILTEELSVKGRKLAEENYLIHAFFERKGLYNKKVQQTFSLEQQEELWAEVAEAVSPS